MIFYQKQRVSTEGIGNAKIDLRVMIKRRMKELLMADVAQHMSKYPKGTGFVVKVLDEVERLLPHTDGELHTVKALVLLESHEDAFVGDYVHHLSFASAERAGRIYVNAARIECGEVVIGEKQYDKVVIPYFNTYCYERVK